MRDVPVLLSMLSPCIVGLHGSHGECGWGIPPLSLSEIVLDIL